MDATCGNGYDTLVLSRLVGPHGMVVACDLQARSEPLCLEAKFTWPISCRIGAQRGG